MGVQFAAALKDDDGWHHADGVGWPAFFEMEDGTRVNYVDTPNFTYTNWKAVALELFKEGVDQGFVQCGVMECNFVVAAAQDWMSRTKRTNRDMSWYASRIKQLRDFALICLDHGYTHMAWA